MDRLKELNQQKAIRRIKQAENEAKHKKDGKWCAFCVAMASLSGIGAIVLAMIWGGVWQI